MFKRTGKPDSCMHNVTNKKEKRKKKKLPITFNYLLDIAIPSKGLSSNNFITDDCTRDAEERPKEHYGRMMDDEFAVNACGLPSPADVHLLFSPSNNHFFFFVILLFSFVKYKCGHCLLFFSDFFFCLFLIRKVLECKT